MPPANALAALPAEYICGQTHVGVSGSGKTYAGARIAERCYDMGGRVLVLDIHREWSRQAQRPFAIVASPADCDRATAKGWRYLVAQPPDMVRMSHTPLIEWALRKRGVLVVVTEAHNYWPAHARPGAGLDQPSAELLTAYRHYGCGFVADSQRISQLSKTCTEQSTTLRVFAVVGNRDLQVLAEIAPGLTDAATQAAALSHRGYKGYHAKVDMFSRVGPFPLVRL